MKIVHLTEAWAGGVSTYVNCLIAAQVKNSDITEVHHIVAKNRMPKEFEKLGKINGAVYHFYRSSRHFLKLWAVSREIQEKIEKINPDIVHMHSTFPGVYGRFLAKKNRSYKIIYCSHGWSFSQDEYWFKKYIYIIIEKFLARKTNVITNISEYEGAMAKKYNILADKNVVIISGVRDVIVSSERPINIDENKINIGFIGRLDRQKGFDLLEQALMTVTRDDLRVYVLGKPERSSGDLKSMDKRIKFVGWIKHNKIDDYIKLFDAVVIPSRWEGFGLVAAEVLRNSVPVLVSNKGALPSFVVRNQNGYVFSLENGELEELLKKLDKDILKKMKKKSRESFEKNYVLDRFVNEVKNIYNFKS